MTFRIPYKPESKTPEEIAAGQKERQIIKDQYKQWQINQKAAREAMLKHQAAEAEAERLAAIAASQPSTAPADTIDISKPTKWINGFLVPIIPEPTAPQVSKIQAMADANNRLRQNVRR